MIKKLQLSLFILCSSYFVFAQCPTSPCGTPMPVTDITQACILPSPSLLDCYIGETTTELAINFPTPNNWCTTVENNHWFAFEANANSTDFFIECISCTAGAGIQVGVLSSTNCQTGNFVLTSECENIEEGNSATISATNLIPGEVYYLMFDGMAGGLCEYSINVNYPDIQSSHGNACAPVNIFAGYTSTVLSEWTIYPNSSGSFAGSNVGTSVEVLWEEEGFSEICAQNIECPNGPTTCFSVSVGSPSFTTEEADICIGGSVICGGQVFHAPGVYTSSLQTWQGCDSVVTCIINVLPPSNEYLYYEICDGECVEFAGTPYCDEGFYQIFIPGGSVNGCDSIIDLELVVIDIPTTFINITTCGDDCYEVAGEIYCETDPFNIFLISQDGCDSVIRVTPNIISVDVEIAEPDALTCLVDTVILDATGSTVGDSVIYLWTGSQGLSSPDFPKVAVIESGLYCLSIIDTVNMEECLECVFVEEVSSSPDTPIIYGPDVIYGDFGLFYTDEVPFVNEYYWGGVSITSILESDPANQIFIEVDHSNPLNNQICVVVENDCGASAQGCHDYILEFPPLDVELLGPTEFCYPGGLFTYLLETEDTSVTNIEWITLGENELIVSQPEVAVVEWANGTDIGAICANVESNQFGNYQICQAIEFFGIDTTIIIGNICSGSCYNYQGIDYCDQGLYQNWYTSTNGCDSLVQLIINEIALPTAELQSGTFEICEGESIDLPILLTGEGPWIVEWQVNGISQTPLNISSSPFFLTLNDQHQGVIELTNVYDQNGCQGTVFGQAQISVLPQLFVSNLQIWPAVDLQTYQLYFEVSGGDPSTYWITPLNGTIQSAFPINFISFPIQCGDGYNFMVSDATGCNPVLVQANSIECECDTESGNMDLTPIAVCGDGPITGNYDNTGLFLDPNDVLNFILHEGNPFDQNQIIEIKNFETFSFNASSMNYGQTYYISAVAANDDGTGMVDITDPCYDVSQGQPVVFYEAPTATISGDGQICEGSGEIVEVKIDFTGVGPWTFSYTEGTSIITETTNQNPFYFSVNQTGTYVLLSVEDSNCTGFVTGQASVTEVPIPTADIIGTGTICAGSSGTVDLDITLTGTAPWVLYYEINGGVSTPIMINSSPFSTSIPISQAGLFTFTELHDANCEGEILSSGVIQITQATAPFINNLIETCNADPADYIVSFEVSSTNLPIEISPPNSGTISQNPPYIFTSNPIPSGSSYNFEITDANDCNPVVVTGLKICDCVTSVGVMDNLAIEECGDGPVTALYDQFNEALDANDVIAYFLHEGDGINIVNQISVNTVEPTFSFLNGQMSYGTTYYISAVAGSDDGSGVPDLNEICTDVAAGTPVVFYEPPTAHLYANQNTLCEDEVELIIEFTGDGPWTFVYEELNSGATVGGNANTNPHTFFVVSNGNSIYTLNSVNNGTCDGAVTGIVEVNGPPIITSISNDTTVCDSDFLQLMVESPSAIEYQWSPATGLSCTDCQFPVAAPTQSTNYTVIVTDYLGCTAEESIEVFVQCLTIYDTLHIGETSIRSLNLPPWIVTQADVCLDDEEHTSIGWFPNGFFYVGLSEGIDTICIPLQHPSSIFNTEVFTVYVTVEKKSIFMFEDDAPTSQVWGEEGKILTQNFIENDISIYPNPTNGILNINSKKELVKKIELFDLSGKHLLEKILNNFSNQLNINHFQAGSYFMKIETETEISYRKVILTE